MLASMTPLLIGVGMALAVALYARVVGLDRERAFYATVLAVVASYYGLYAVIGGSTRAIVLEAAIAAVFLVMVAVGFRRSQWIVVAGLAAHGVFDLFHGHVIENPGMPVWWPDFCMAYDLTAAAVLGWMLLSARKNKAVR
jgi:hypothetical protein